MNEIDAGELGRLTVTLTPEVRDMLRQIMERKYPGRRGMASVVVEEAIRRLYEAEVKQR